MSADHGQLERARPTYEELHQQHQEHEQRLAELNNKAWLSPAEELEEKRLKKLKLHLKDQMENIRRSAS